MASKSTKARKSPRSVRRPWWRLAVLGTGLLMMIGAAGTWLDSVLSDPNRLPLKTIRITGELSHVDRARMQRLVAEAIDGGFFTVDMHKLRTAAEQLPWVDEVSIRRVWPQTLVMAVTEQLPLARWGDQALVNGRGEVFAPEGSEPPAGLPQFFGPKSAAAQMVAFYRQAGRRLAAAGREIRQLSLQGQHDWQLQLDDGLVLVMRQAQAAQALDRFVLALPAIRDQAGRVPEQIDMRYDNGFAVRWAPSVNANPKNQQQGDA
jgi:cell division protein FtsQ